MKKALFTLLLTLAMPLLAVAQNPCLELIRGEIDPMPQFINPDSVHVDTCSDSPTYGQMFTRRFGVTFYRAAFLPLNGPPDTIIRVTADDMIDSTYKSAFHALQLTFGPGSFVKEDPEDSLRPQRWFRFELENYAPAEQLIQSLEGLADFAIVFSPPQELTKVSQTPEKTAPIPVLLNGRSLQVTAAEPPDRLSIVDCLGRSVRSLDPSQHTHDLRSLPSGVYFVLGFARPVKVVLF